METEPFWWVEHSQCPLVWKETNGPFVAYYNQAKLPCTFHSVHGGSPTSTCSSHSAGTQLFLEYAETSFTPSRSEKTGGCWESNPGSLWLHFPQSLPHNVYIFWFQHEARCSEHLEWKKSLTMGSLLMERTLQSTPDRVLRAHILCSCQVFDWGIQYHLCSTYRGLWGL